MQQPQWKGAKSLRFEGGRRHIQPIGELSNNLQPTLSTIGACGIRTFNQQLSEEAIYKPHMRIFEQQYKPSQNQIDPRGKKFIPPHQQQQRIRPQKSHIPGGQQTSNQFVNRGIRSFEYSNSSSKDQHKVEDNMQRKTRVPDFESQRNNIAVASLGDKPYKYPEYATNFYKPGGLIPGSTFRPLPEHQKQIANKNIPVFTKPNWNVKVKMEEIQQQKRAVNSVDEWEQTTLKEANPNWNDPDTFFQRMEANKKDTKDQKKGGKK